MSSQRVNSSALEALYQAVDNKDVSYLASVLADSVRFRLGNFPEITGKEAVLDANHSFFNSITSMSHCLDKVWQQGNELICTGSVDYVRLDSTELSVRFATVLGYKAGLIDDYQVYVDVSEL